MGLFKHKKAAPTPPPEPPITAVSDAPDSEEHFFDENFREELRNHGRWYFEKIINENAALFKQDLAVTTSQINADLREHVTRQLDEAIVRIGSELKEHLTSQIDAQFAEHNKAIKDAQNLSMVAITRSSQAIEEQHKQLTERLAKSISDQEASVNGVLTENKAKLEEMGTAEATALELLNRSVQTLKEQQEQLAGVLEKRVAEQEALLMKSFEENMAQVIEHYLLGAIGDQYDIKAQLPSIIKQLEADKQTIVDDMKL